MPPRPGMSCGDCDLDERKQWGCTNTYGRPWVDGGGEGYKSCHVYKPSNLATRIDTKDAPKFMLVCPQYYANSPFVSAVFDDLEDYKANRLGDVRDMPYPMLAYYRFADSEKRKWEAYWESKLNKDAMSKAKK